MVRRQIARGIRLEPTPESNLPSARSVSPIWPVLSLLIGWGVGAAGLAIGIDSGFLPTAHPIEVVELTVGVVIYGFFVGLIAGQITQAAIRKRGVPWI